jgi:DNA-binding transcriptional ArsR family regulator
MSRITRRKLNFAFWAFYVLTAAVLISGLIANAILAAILLSLLVITAGFHGLLEEFASRENKKAFRRIDESIQQVSDWVQRSYFFSKDIKERFDLRFHSLDTKRSQLEQKVEKNSKDLKKRVIEMENKFNSLKRSIAAERPKPLTTFERRIGRAVKLARREGMVTTTIYSRSIRVSRTVARNDLKKLSGMNIVRKRGKGRNAYYILAV